MLQHKETYIQLISADDKSPAWTLNKQKSLSFDKSLKQPVLSLSAHLTKLSYSRHPLPHKYLLFQLLILPGQSFSLEFSITDSTNRKKRVLFTSSAKTVSCNASEAKIPCSTFPRDVWVNLCIDTADFLNFCFPGAVFKAIGSLTVHSHCRLRKVLSLSTIDVLSDVQNVGKSEHFSGGLSLHLVKSDSLRTKTSTFYTSKTNAPTRSVSTSKRPTLVSENRGHQTCYGRMAVPTIEFYEEIAESIHVSSDNEEAILEDIESDNSPVHNFFPLKIDVKEPTPQYYDTAVNRIIQLRPFTPPFVTINTDIDDKPSTNN